MTKTPKNIEFWKRIPTEIPSNNTKLVKNIQLWVKRYGNIIQNSILYSKIEVKIFLKVNKSVFTIRIEDDGDGFSRDVLDKLGEPYISKNKKGMGLGIFIAKNLIENMKGNIIFYNSNNNGAVVEINFDKTILI